MKRRSSYVLTKLVFAGGLYEVVVDPEHGGGWGRMVEPAHPTGKICIGLRHKEWACCLAVLLHELGEMTMHEMRCGLEPGWAAHFGSSDIRRFFMTHDEGTEVIARVAGASANVIPLLQKAYNAAKKITRSKK